MFYLWGGGKLRLIFGKEGLMDKGGTLPPLINNTKVVLKTFLIDIRGGSGARFKLFQIRAGGE